MNIDWWCIYGSHSHHTDHTHGQSDGGHHHDAISHREQSQLPDVLPAAGMRTAAFAFAFTTSAWRFAYHPNAVN